jgi:hypothetical protein
MKYSILELQEKEGKTGNKYHLATLREESEEGTESKVSSFDLAGKKIADIVEGEIVQNGQYHNFKIKKEFTTGGKGAGVSKAVEIAQVRKETSINKTLDRKEDSFKITATFRDATILTQIWSQKTPFPTTEEIEEKWKHFRIFLLNNYDVEITDTKAF